MFVCLVKDSSLLPTYVSLVQSKFQQNISLNKIHIHNYLQAKVVRNITVCVMTALWGNIKDVQHVRNFIEINNYFGGDYFTIYNYTGLGIEVDRLLWQYIQKGLIEIIQYPIIDILANDTLSKGQHIVLQDCIYRNIFKSNYIVMVDLDEIIVPHAFKSWINMIKGIGQVNTCCGYLFRNVFFYKNTNGTHTDNSKIPALDWTERDQFPWGVHTKSKMIYDTKYVELIRVHHVVKCLHNKSRIVTVSTDLALMHHYRVPQYSGPGWISNGKNVWKASRITDSTMKQFENDIRMRIKHVK